MWYAKLDLSIVILLALTYYCTMRETSVYLEHSALRTFQFNLIAALVIVTHKKLSCLLNSLE